MQIKNEGHRGILWTARPLIMDESSARMRNEKLEMVVRRKNNEAPQNFDSASRRRHLERSPRSSLQNGQYANCAASITTCF